MTGGAMDELVADFIGEAAEALGGLQAGLARLAVVRNDQTAAIGMLRRLHGLKGVCGFVGFPRAEALAHAGESLLASMVGAAPPPAALAPLGDMIQRLVLLLSEAADSRLEPLGDDSELIARLEAFTDRLQAIGQPYVAPAPSADGEIGLDPATGERRTRAPWTGLETLASALGDRLGKRIELVVGGDDIRIAPAATGALRTALIALVRNACDHGVETTVERRAAGKPALSHLRLSILHRGEGALIELADDGRGIDPAAVRARWPAAAQALSDSEVQALVFSPGVTTAATLTAISGRGLGLDVVRRELERLGGTATLDSVPGRGARFLMTLPATALVSPVAGQVAA